jgi:capsular exopolysaccharide synthesis family protein
MGDASFTRNGRMASPPTVVVPPSAGARSEELPPHRTTQPENGDFGHLLQLIWRRKPVLAAFVIIGMVLCTVAITQITPAYTARGLVLVGAPGAHIVDLQAVLSGVSAETDAVASQIEVLQSWALADAVVERLSLDRNPEFNPRLRPRTLWDEVGSALDYLRRLVLGVESVPEADPLSPRAVAAAERKDAVLSVLSGLSISPRERSRLLDVAFTSEDPNLAAKIVNTLLGIHIAQQVDKKYEATLGATEALSRNVISWQQRTSESERRIEEFRAREDLLEGERGILLLRQLSETNDQLTAATVARSLAEASLRQVEEYGLDATLDGTEQQHRSPVLQGLRQREAQLMATEAEMRAKYGADHARVASVQAELQRLRDVMAGELDRVIRGLKVEVARDRSIEQTLSVYLERLIKQVAAANLARVELDALRREADANRRMLEVFTSRLAETRGQADRAILQPDASIITHAGVPLIPSYPKPKLYFALVFVLAIGAGLLFVVLAETLRRGFRSGDEIEYATGVPVLGLLPRVPGSGWLPRMSSTWVGAAPLSRLLASRRSAAVENSVGWLGSSLLLNNHQSRVITLTSAKTGEGKTTAAIALARFLARANCATLLIEADLYRPQIHKTFDVPASPGLRDLLRGSVSLDAVLHRDDASGVYTLAAGTADLQASDALPWSAIEPLLVNLRQRFDLVIIDGPPILQAPEASLLSRLADATIFIVQWSKTDRRIVTAGLDQIAQSGGRIAGLLLTTVSARKYARYADGDSHCFLLETRRRSLQ